MGIPGPRDGEDSFEQWDLMIAFKLHPLLSLKKLHVSLFPKIGKNPFAIDETMVWLMNYK